MQKKTYAHFLFLEYLVSLLEVPFNHFTYTGKLLIWYTRVTAEWVWYTLKCLSLKIFLLWLQLFGKCTSIYDQYNKPDQFACWDQGRWQFFLSSLHAFQTDCHGNDLACPSASEQILSWFSWAVKQEQKISFENSIVFF